MPPSSSSETRDGKEYCFFIYLTSSGYSTLIILACLLFSHVASFTQCTTTFSALQPATTFVHLHGSDARVVAISAARRGHAHGAGDVLEARRRVHELLQVVAHGHGADGRDRDRCLEPREHRAPAHDARDDPRHAHRRAVRERVVVDHVEERQHARAEEHHAQRGAAHERRQVALHHVPGAAREAHEHRVRERRVVHLLAHGGGGGGRRLRGLFSSRWVF